MLTQNYFYALAWGVIPIMIVSCIGQFFNAVSKPRMSLIFSIVSIVITVIPGYALIFGKFGMPHLGMSGYAWAITFKNYIILIAMLAFIYFHKSYRKFHIFDLSRT